MVMSEGHDLTILADGLDSATYECLDWRYVAQPR